MLNFNSTSFLLENAKTLETYKELMTSNREPKLAVYKEDQLIIVSKKAVQIHEHVIEFFKKGLYFLYEKIGLLSYKQESLQQIEKRVDDFYCEQKTRIGNSFTVEINEKQQQLNELNHKITASSKFVIEYLNIQNQLAEARLQASSSQAEFKALSEKVQAEQQALNLLTFQIREKTQSQCRISRKK